MQKNLENEPDDYEGDEYLICNPGQEYERRLFHAWLIMRQPCVWEMLVRIMMAFLASLEKIFFNNGLVASAVADDIVRTVTIRTNGNGLARHIVLALLHFIKAERDAMEIAQVGFHNVCRETVFAHDLILSVTVAAYFGNPVTVINRKRVLDRVRRMTIDANRHVLIVLIE